MTIETLCIGLIAMFFGLVVAFAGYRLFLVLLPIWGFFFGFYLGAHTIQLIFDVGFLSEVTSWVVGFFAGMVFAVLSYLFYALAVAVIAGSLGYGLGTGFMHLIGVDWGFLVWIVGIILAVVVIVITFRFNIQKYVIIGATGIGGAAIIIGSFLFAFGIGGFALSHLVDNPVQTVINESFLWLLFFLVVAGLGIASQVVSTRDWYVEEPENRI